MTTNLQQQVFALSIFSGAAANQSGTVQSLTELMTTKLQSDLTSSCVVGLIGQWNLAWGPYVFQAEGSDQADNAMYVAVNSDKSIYVVAVAATNPTSMYDWLTEDLGVNSLAPLPNADATVQISNGTLIGLNSLLALGGPFDTLAAFLVNLAKTSGTSGSQIIFTGHSLGGALAPALALSLFNGTAGPLHGLWPATSVSVLPTAGPSVGNQDYVTLYTNTFSGSTFYKRIYNTLDVVPQAWDPATCTLNNLSNIYAGDSLPATSCIQYCITNALANLPTTNPYVALPSQSFSGEFKAAEVPFIDNTNYYLAEALYQHIRAYIENIIPGLITCGFTGFDPFTFEYRFLIATYLGPKIEAYCNQKCS